MTIQESIDNKQNPDDFYTVPEGAFYLKIHEHTLRLIAKNGDIKHKRLGKITGKILIQKQWLDEWKNTPTKV